MKLRVFTDGACSNNPGPGGWASIINLKDKSIVLKGNEIKTTNNRMELTAVVQATKKIIEKNFFHCDCIEIHSDSAYVVNAINNEWIEKWRVNGWKTSKGDDIKNRDLWESLSTLLDAVKESKVSMTFKKVKGHSGNTFNEMADDVAKEQSIIAKSLFNKKGDIK